ncbi:MAG TPA: DUF4126 domain-containing protein [Candidatus Krumholzibacteria bacterium]|nr:DUF4126 domain-containing protein [Candidatus Krumholzibacteria bacterium]
MFETGISILVGVGLAAACGFRVFLPLLVLSIAARVGHIPLAHDFEWVASTPALIALSTATLAEIVAYYVPWLDHALDTVATPTAILAGVVATAAVAADLPPVLRWGVAVLAGGGLAGTVQGATVLTRLKSGAMTAGLGNPVVSTLELGGSLITSILAVLVPLLAVSLVVALLVWLFRRSRRFLFGRRQAAANEPNESVDDFRNTQ